MDDRALLEQLVETGSNDAFGELVRRHIDMVYSAALRQTGEHALAEDVTQSVFVLLARKGRSIRESEALAGWLLAATRFTAINAIRAESRRRRHEREAAAMKSEIQSESPAWEKIQPLLDEAVTRLGRDDRDAITLRYFKGQGVSQIAAALGVSESAAQKRISRALERLRAFFVRKGVAASSQGLASVLAVNVISSAPAQLSAQIVQQASTISIATKGAVLMATTKTKFAVAACAAVVLAGVSVPVIYNNLHSTNTASVPTTTVSPAMAQPVARDALAAIYALAPGEDFKRFQPPFPPERRAFHGTLDPQEVGSRPPDSWSFKWIGDGFADDGSMRIGSPHDVSDALSSFLGIWPQDTDISLDILSTRIPGDWVIRADIPKSQLAGSFARSIPEAIGPGMTLRPEPVEREVIVVRGRVNFAPLSEATEDERQARAIRISRTETLNGRTPKGRGQNTTLVMNMLGQILRWPVVVDTALDDNALRGWTLDLSADFRKADPPDGAVVDEVLANVMKQTGLEMKRERRTVQVWRLVQASSDVRSSSVYGLAPAQNVKRVFPPFGPEREQASSSIRMRPNDPMPQSAIFTWNGTAPRSQSWNRDAMDFAQVLKEVMLVQPQDADVPRHLLGLAVSGDWVIREGATQQQRIIDTIGATEDVVGEGMTLKLEPMEREAIVVRGGFQFERTRTPNGTANQLTVSEVPGSRDRVMAITQTPREMLLRLGELMSRPMVIEIEADQKSQAFVVKYDKSTDFSRAVELPSGEVVDEILKKIAEQTGLEFKRERRTVPTWRLVKQGS